MIQSNVVPPIKLSTTHFICNICHQHRYNPGKDSLENILAYHPNFHKQDMKEIDLFPVLNTEKDDIEYNLKEMAETNKNEVTYKSILPLLEDANVNAAGKL